MTTTTRGAARAGEPFNASNLMRRLGMLPVLVVLYLAMYGLTVYFSADGTSTFMTSNNTMNIFRQVSINIVLASGMTFVILTSGIDLSVGSVLALVAVVTMQVYRHNYQGPETLSTASTLAILAGVAVGGL